MVAVGNGVLNEVSPLERHASVKFTLFASVPSFAPAGNDVRAEQFCHADVKSPQLSDWIAPKSLNAVHPNQALLRVLELLKSKAGNFSNA